MEWYLVWLVAVGVVANAYLSYKLGRVATRFLLAHLCAGWATFKVVMHEIAEGKKSDPTRSVVWWTLHKAIAERYRIMLLHEAVVAPSLQARVTCIGKGGVYDQLGIAAGAGTSKGERIIVYRDRETSCLYYRLPDDYFDRMAVYSVLHM